MTARQRLRQERKRITALAAYHGARDIRVFGSVARGEDHAGSDVDLLVVMDAGRSLFDQSVDVVSEGGLREPARERILREAVSL